MDEFVRSLIWLSVKSSFIIVLILSAKSLFGRFFNARTHYYVWFVLIMTLTVPYTFIDAGDVSASLKEGFIRSAYESLEDMPTDASRKVVARMNTEDYQAQGGLEGGIQKTNHDEKSISLNPMNIIAWIWFSGVIFLSLLVIWNLIAIKKSISKEKEILDGEVLAIFNRCKVCLGIKKEVKIVRSRNFSTPSVSGYHRPVVLLPHKMVESLDAQKLEFIFMHELAHVKRRDVLMNWVILAYQIIYWFNPLVCFGLIKMKNDIELVCDEEVLKNLKEDKRLIYGRTIIELLEYLTKPHLAAPGMSFLKNRNELKRRVIMIKTYRGKFTKSSILGLLIILMVALVSAIGCEKKDERGISAAEAFSKEDMEQILEEASTHSIEPFSARKIEGVKESVLGSERESMEKMIGEPYINTYYVNVSEVESGDVANVAVYPISADETDEERNLAFYVMFEGGEVVDCKIEGFNGITDDSFGKADYKVDSYPYETGDIKEKKLFNKGDEFDLEKFKNDFIGRSLSDFKDKFGRVHGFSEVVRKKDGIRLSVYPITLDYSSPTPALFIVSEDNFIKDIKRDGAWGALQFERLEGLLDY